MGKSRIVPLMLGTGLTGTKSAHDGLLADFINGRFYAKPGQSFAAAQSMFTWSSSTKNVRGSTLLLRAAPANQPAYEFDSSANALGAALEGAYTNSNPNSDGSGWTPFQCTFDLASSETNPFGTTGGVRKLAATATSGAHGPSLGVTTTAAPWTKSPFVKAAERSWVYVRCDNAAPNAGAYFNLATGAIGTVEAGVTARVESYANGWYRCFVSRAGMSAALGYNVIVLALSDGVVSYDGAANPGGILTYGMDFGAHPFGSSPVLTSGSAVTRNADNVSRSLGSEWSAAAGTAYVEFSVPSITSSPSDRTIFSIDDGTRNNEFRYRIQAGQSDADFLVTTGGVAQADIDGPAITPYARVKAAMAWAANDFELVVNGVSQGIDTGGTLPSVTTLRLGAGPLGNDGLFGHLRRFELWPSRLSQSQMIGLTA